MKQERKEVMVVNGLTNRISTITAEDNISFSIPDSQIFEFVGPNGAGKKTTIRMLTDLLTPDAGDISIGGKYDNERKQHER
jgi:ABC-type multidrug transport system ATPase subunit